MPTVSQFSHSQLDRLPEQSVAAEEVRGQVLGLLSTLYPKVTVVERGRERAIRFRIWST